jgi:hypothetical protein
MACARRLIHVPILHAPADMGTAAAELEAAYVARLGRRHWDQHLALLGGFWPAVRAALDKEDLDYRHVDLYQDGLPVCGREPRIVAQAAAGGSANYRLLADLAARGAALVGTEAPGLLLEEYRRVQAALHPAAGRAPQPASPSDLLARRDAYIARRIGSTLSWQRTGILFLGVMHRIELLLPTDIVVTHLALPSDPRP